MCPWLGLVDSQGKLWRETRGHGDRHVAGDVGSRRPPPLSVGLILSTAIGLMDSEGAQGLTMRRLGEALGVEAMSLYHHVNGREDLLEGVVDQLVDQIRVAPEAAGEPTPGWQSVLQLLAHEVRELALAHPKIFPLIATRHPAAPWLRPPLRSLRVVEEFLRALTSRGFSDAQAARATGPSRASCWATCSSKQPVRAPRRPRWRSPSTRETPTSPTAQPSSRWRSSRPSCG